tara:strand:- start:22245 stop:22514 length:270 start_codon:yes stop_codon:yes gene_type:complete
MSNEDTNNDEFEDLVIGQTITNFRPISEAEIIDEEWDRFNNCWMCSVMELSNGMRIYPSQDSEGNGPGCLYGITAEGKRIYVIAESDSD